MKNSWEEYKERKAAQNYFRQNNDLYLSSRQWIKTISASLLGAIALGIILGAITLRLNMNFSILYIVIGYAVANIVTSVSGVSSKQMGIVSGCMTLFAFFVSRLFLFVLLFGFSLVSITMAFQTLLSGGIIS